MFQHAIVRIPAATFRNGLTASGLGAPDYAAALAQHRIYCLALQTCGLKLTVLEPDPRYPDSTFVEDTAILTPKCAVLTRPGANSRSGEVSANRSTIEKFYQDVEEIKSPGTLDGGDICEADGHFFIGLSERTNPEGGQQLAEILARYGYTSSFIPVQGIPGILHLKSGLSYLGNGVLVAAPALAGREEFQAYTILAAPAEELYAANCIRVNQHVLMPKGFLRLKTAVLNAGFSVIPVEMSEFQKMDGGLSCLSLRF